MSENRLTKLEEDLVFQERHVAELSRIVYKQQQQIDALTATCNSLVGKMSDLSNTQDPAPPADERPPHY
ncbi:MAG: SlyX family protein [Kiritimatiellae bacterium]|nr:SlyX family protein [Kiritimatiellia bacterium]